MAWMDNFDKNTTAVFYKRTLVTDGMGGATYSVSTGTVIQGEFWQKSANELVVSDRVHNPAQYSFATDPTTEINEMETCIISGDTYTVHRPEDVMLQNDIFVVGLEYSG